MENTDQLLVQRDGALYRIEAQDLMANLKDDDLLIVERGGTNYQTDAYDLRQFVKPDAVRGTEWVALQPSQIQMLVMLYNEAIQPEELRDLLGLTEIPDINTPAPAPVAETTPTPDSGSSSGGGGY